MNELSDPLTRLAVLPTAMNWRGVWGNADQYYKNDVAISPTNNASYILFGQTADAGQDPIGNPAWFELFPHTTGLHQLVAGNGIQITPVPGPATPTLTNTGVRTLLANTGLGTFGGQTPLVFNTGVLGIVTDPSVGLSWDVSTSTLLNEGVVGTSRVGITNTGSPQNQVLESLGILGINGSANVAVSVGSGIATLTNTGVTQLRAGAGIDIDGNPSNPTVTTLGGARTSVLASTGPPVPNPIPINVEGIAPVAASPYLIQTLVTPPPSSPNPYWLFDFTGWWVSFGTLPGPTQLIRVKLRDTTTPGGPYTYTSTANTGSGEVDLNDLLTPPRLGFANLGWIFAPLQGLRAAGLQTIDEVVIVSSTASLFQVNGGGEIKCLFFPNYSP